MVTPYYLAIDVGTSRTAAATARSAPDGTLLAAPLPLGRNADSTPTTVFISDSGLLFGDAAERRGTTQPERLVREFKRRIGDDVPIVAGDRRFSPQDLYALVVGWVIGTAVEREGRHPAGIAVSVPVTWGEYRTQLVQDAIGRLGWSDVQVITEPEAAARHYEATHPLDTGRALAVYDFGGGTFDTVILQKTADGRVDFVGSPVGIPDLGGADFDDIVLRHTVKAAGIPASALAGAQTDAGVRMALASLRRECVDAKESLSFDGEAVVPVLIGDGHGAVRLTRSEFEDMIEPEIERTVEVLDIALEQSGLTPDDLDAILLTGGTSRIPRVAQLLSERFDRPIAIDADPKAIIALGAARTAAGGALLDPSPAPTPLTLADIAPMEADGGEDDDDDATGTESGFAAKRGERRAPWFRRLPATAYVAAGVAALTVSVGVISVPALGIGILARGGPGVTSQPLAADLEVQLFDPLDLPSSPPPSIATPGAVPVDQPAAPPESGGAEQPRAADRGEERQRSPQRLTPQAAEQRSPSASTGQQPASGANGGGGQASTPQQGAGNANTSSDTPVTPPQPTGSSPSDTAETGGTPVPTPGDDGTGDTPDPTPVPTGGTGGTGDPSGGSEGGNGSDNGTGGENTGGDTSGGTDGGSTGGSDSGSGGTPPEASPSSSASAPEPSASSSEPTP